MTRRTDPEPTGTAVITADTDDGWAPITGRKTLPIALPSRTERYLSFGELGRGTMGIVEVAEDVALARRVALKRLRPDSPVPNAAARFLDEARITAQLQHPGIVAVHEIDVAEDRTPFFTMQLVEGRTLKAIIDGLAQGNPELLRRFGRVRLLNIYLQLCMAVAYAHSRGVIHRDLKPENVMLGEYGEVFVMDWGLAKVLTRNVPQPVVSGRPDGPSFRTRVGDITGTPAYMSPEQAMGLVDALSERSDLYSLGAILYELLTLRPPFAGASTAEILRRVRQGELTPPSAVADDVPPELEAVVLKAMARDPTDRHASAVSLRDEVEAFLAGGASPGRVRTAAKVLRDAARAGQAYRDFARKRRRLAREVAETLAHLLPFEEPDPAAAERLAALTAEQTRAFEQSLALYLQVLAEAPEHEKAQEGLRDLAWYRFLEAERASDPAAMEVYQGLTLQCDPRRVLGPALKGDGSLSVTTQPPGARLTLIRADESRPLGFAPLLEPLEMGSYALHAEAPGYEPQIASVLIARLEAAELKLTLLPKGRLPEGCVVIPAGSFYEGSALPHLGAPPRQRLVLPAFIIARCPVTVDEYAAFLNGLVARGKLSQARKHIPKGGPWTQGRDGRFHPEAHGRNPVTGITVKDALAYCADKAQRDGLPWRLPTAAEWEKAARGADGRDYPWGDTFRPAACRSAESLEGGAPSAVGNELDQSVYGVMDLAGGVREWTATEHPKDPRQRAVKGGGFNDERAGCHLAVRRFRKLERESQDLGFRLALDLDSASQ